MIVKLTIFGSNFLKKVFPTKNRKIALVCASMDFSYYIKLFCSGSDRHNDILISFLILVAERISVMADILKIYSFSKIKSSQDDIHIFVSSQYVVSNTMQWKKYSALFLCQNFKNFEIYILFQ